MASDEYARETERPTTYHDLHRARRDLLLATHIETTDCDSPPNGKQVITRVQHLRNGERPSNTTGYDGLHDLADWGYLAEDERGWRVTERGRELLRRAGRHFPD